MLNNIPVVSLEFCEFDADKKIMYMSSEYFGVPKKFIVRNKLSEEMIFFNPISETDTFYVENFSEENSYVYCSENMNVGINYFIIYHKY